MSGDDFPSSWQLAASNLCASQKSSKRVHFGVPLILNLGGLFLCGLRRLVPLCVPPGDQWNSFCVSGI